MELDLFNVMMTNQNVTINLMHFIWISMIVALVCVFHFLLGLETSMDILISLNIWNFLWILIKNLVVFLHFWLLHCNAIISYTVHFFEDTYLYIYNFKFKIKICQKQKNCYGFLSVFTDLTYPLQKQKQHMKECNCSQRYFKILNFKKKNIKILKVGNIYVQIL